MNEIPIIVFNLIYKPSQPLILILIPLYNKKYNEKQSETLWFLLVSYKVIQVHAQNQWELKVFKLAVFMLGLTLYCCYNTPKEPLQELSVVLQTQTQVFLLE